MAEVDAEEADDGGLFGISLDSSDESSTETQESEKKLPRDFQSEEDFQTVKTTYRPKVEIGEIWKTLQLPIDNPTKQEVQTVLHAIEELYFQRRYLEARGVADEALRGKLGVEVRLVVIGYKERCERKLIGD